MKCQYIKYYSPKQVKTCDNPAKYTYFMPERIDEEEDIISICGDCYTEFYYYCLSHDQKLRKTTVEQFNKIKKVKILK